MTQCGNRILLTFETIKEFLIKTGLKTLLLESEVLKLNSTWLEVKSEPSSISIANVSLDQIILWRTQARYITQNAGVDNDWNFTDLGKKAGYTRVMVNVSISGTGSSFMNHYQTSFVDDSTNIRLKNLATVDTGNYSGNVRVSCLYIRDGFFA